MAILFAPDHGQILMCDFTAGFMRAEMQKIRHCIVVSPKKHTGTCLVVPLSTLAPAPVEAWHYLIPRHTYPCIECGADVWAKGDMLTHAAFARLSRPKENHVEVRRSLQPAHLKEILKAVVHAINCGHVAAHI
jgi:mRNA interferase MazF